MKPNPLTISLLASSATAAWPVRGAERLDLGRVERRSVEVLCVPRKARRLVDMPAALTALTAEDIRQPVLTGHRTH